MMISCTESDSVAAMFNAMKSISNACKRDVCRGVTVKSSFCKTVTFMMLLKGPFGTRHNEQYMS